MLLVCKLLIVLGARCSTGKTKTTYNQFSRTTKRACLMSMPILTMAVTHFLILRRMEALTLTRILGLIGIQYRRRSGIVTLATSNFQETAAAPWIVMLPWAIYLPV